MTPLLILLISLSFFSAALGIASFFLIKPVFLRINPNLSEWDNYKKSWNAEAGLSFIYTAVFISQCILILLCCSLEGETLNDAPSYWLYFVLAGVFAGFLSGEAYYYVVRNPFYRKNYPAEVEKVRKGGHYSHSMWSSAVVMNFMEPLCSLLMGIGLLIACL